MKDLKSQLGEVFGAPTPEPTTDAAPQQALPPILADNAHLADPWVARLRVLCRTTSGAPKLEPILKLARARQATDQVARLLKNSGRKRDAAELLELRAAFLSRQDKAAWGEVKSRFAALGLSEKAYRALKQGKVDPIDVLHRLARADPAELAGMGASRLKELLAG